jgi:hypothetical protein
MAFDAIDTYAAAFAAVFGGIGVKLLDKVMSKRSEQFLEATKIREELRAEVVVLRQLITQAEAETVEWRSKYYAQMEENITLNSEVQRLQMLADPTKAPKHS